MTTKQRVDPLSYLLTPTSTAASLEKAAGLGDRARAVGNALKYWFGYGSGGARAAAPAARAATPAASTAVHVASSGLGPAARAAEAARAMPGPAQASMWRQLGGTPGALQMGMGGVGGYLEGTDLDLPVAARLGTAGLGAAAFHPGLRRGMVRGPGGARRSPWMGLAHLGVDPIRGRMLGRNAGFMADFGASLVGSNRFLGNDEHGNPVTGPPGFERMFANLGMGAGLLRGGGRALSGLNRALSGLNRAQALRGTRLGSAAQNVGLFGRGMEDIINSPFRRAWNWARGPRPLPAGAAAGGTPPLAGGVHGIGSPGATVSSGATSGLGPAARAAEAARAMPAPRVEAPSLGTAQVVGPRRWGRAAAIGGVTALGVPLAVNAFADTAGSRALRTMAQQAPPYIHGAAHGVGDIMEERVNQYLAARGMLNQQGRFDPMRGAGHSLMNAANPFLQMLGYQHPEQLSQGQRMAGVAGAPMMGAGLMTGNPALMGVGAGLYAYPHLARGGNARPTVNPLPGQPHFTGLDRDEAMHQSRNAAPFPQG